MFKLKSMAAAIVALFLSFGIAQALPAAAVFITYSCGEGQPAGWMVFEDLNGDGMMDHCTKRYCDGEIVSGPFPAGTLPRSRGIVLSDPGITFNFEQSTCSGTYQRLWVVSEYASGPSLTATITHSCADSITISYPVGLMNRIAEPSLGQASSTENQAYQNRSDHRDVISQMFPNPANGSTTVRIPELKVDGTVKIMVTGSNGWTVYLTETTADQIKQGYVVPTEHMISGSYIVTILDNGGKPVATQTFGVAK